MQFNYAVMTFMALICIATIGMMIFGAVRNNNGLLEMGFDLATIAVSGTIGALAVQLGAQRLDLLANCICGWGTTIEPRLAESESAVLPLDDPPMRGMQ